MPVCKQAGYHAGFVSASVSDEIYDLIRQKGITIAELARRSGMSDVYLYQILDGRRKPSRDRLLCLCYDLECGLEKTQQILQKCRYVQLYSKNRRDAAIMFGLNRGWTIQQLNDNLYQIEEETMF